VTQLSQLQSYDRLRPEDIEKLKQYVKDDSPADSSATNTSASPVNSESEYWKLKDKIDHLLAPKEMKALLELNKLPTTGGRTTLVSRLADAMWYGVATCPMCQQNDMIFTEGIFFFFLSFYCVPAN